MEIPPQQNPLIMDPILNTTNININPNVNTNAQNIIDQSKVKPTNVVVEENRNRIDQLSHKQGQYLNRDALLKIIPQIDVKPEDLGTTDNYHEEKILKTYLSLDEEGQALLYKSAVQLAIIGYGNKNYGFIRLNDKEVISLVDIFRKYNVRFNEPINAKYNDSELSARRLIRLFRFQIQNFIETTNRPSYLWLKYADRQQIQYMSLCFPGGEHLVDTQDQALFLMLTYANLDVQFNSRFRQRLQRVFIARGVLPPQYFTEQIFMPIK